MPRLTPFRPLRYSEGAGDPALLLAPPYDVISPDEARELRGRSPYNCVRLVLPEPAGSDERYERAAALLREWTEEGILERDPEPAVFAYEQEFPLGGERRARRSLLAALRLVPLDRGEVLPHEETHTGPREDRRALTRACGAQLSPVFLVAPDPNGRLRRLLAGAGGSAPLLDASTPDGIRHRLWRAGAGGGSEELCEAAGARPLLLADGHHRYETALSLAEGWPGREAARSILACVVPGTDPGLAVLPTHRTLDRPPEGSNWDELLARLFRPEPARRPLAEAPAEAAEAGGGAIVAASPGREPVLLRPRAEAAAALPSAARDLPPVLFDRLVLRRGFGADAERAARSGLLGYHRSVEEAVAAAGPEGLAFLLPPLGPERVWEAARSLGRLPPKSTYFWPKIPSGLAFREL